MQWLYGCTGGTKPFIARLIRPYLCGDESNISRGMHIKNSGSGRDLSSLTHSSQFPSSPIFPPLFPRFSPIFPRFSPVFPVFPPFFPVFPPSVSLDLCHRLSSL